MFVLIGKFNQRVPRWIKSSSETDMSCFVRWLQKEDVRLVNVDVAFPAVADDGTIANILEMAYVYPSVKVIDIIKRPPWISIHLSLF